MEETDWASNHIFINQLQKQEKVLYLTETFLCMFSDYLRLDTLGKFFCLYT